MVRIEPFLLDGELLLGSCGTGRGIACATDTRLLRVERTMVGHRVRDLSYAEVASIAVGEEIGWTTVGLGVVVVGLGLALPRIVAGLLSSADLVRPLRLTTSGAEWVWATGLFVATVGMALAGYALMHRRPYVSLHGPGLLRQRAYRREWRFATPTASDARLFAMLVRSRLTERGRVGEKKVLPFDTV